MLDAIDNCPQYGDEVVKVEANLQLPPLQASGQRVPPLEEASHLRIPGESGIMNFLLHLSEACIHIAYLELCLGCLVPVLVHPAAKSLGQYRGSGLKRVSNTP